MPAAKSPEMAVARTRPEYRIAVRRASSFLVYQQDRRKNAPGKNGASAIPDEHQSMCQAVKTAGQTHPSRISPQ